MLLLFSITVSCLLVLQNQLPYDKISFMMNHDEVNHIENLKSTRVFHRPHMSSRSLITYETIGAEILPCESPKENQRSALKKPSTLYELSMIFSPSI